MDFFSRQAQARSKTRRLVVMFLLACAAIVAAVNLVVLAAMGALGDGFDAEAAAGTAVVTTVITVLVIAIASLIRTAQLRGGGEVVARALGGTRVAEDTQDFQLRRLRNVVEEMAIAAGTPVPAIFVLEQEAGLNAFAAGWSPSDAAVAVTRGALDQLTRDELQAVMGHEFSHILNGDMRLNIRLMGVLFGILVIAIIGEKLMRSARYSGGRRDGGGQIALVGVGLFAIGWIGIFFGRMIQSAVSRSREFLADAAAVQFTRQNTGLASALKKIAALSHGSQLQTEEGEEVGHMLFASGLASRMFATHPPLEARIRRLDPNFRLNAYLSTLPATARNGLNEGQRPDHDVPIAGAAAAVAGFAAAGPALVAAAGAVTGDHLRVARETRAAIPAALQDAAHSTVQAADVIFALLLSSDAEVAEHQLQRVLEDWGQAHRESVVSLSAAARALPPLARLPLAALTLPALRRRPPQELQRLRATVHALIHADQRVAVFEYALGAMLETQLDDARAPAARSAAGRATLAKRQGDIALLLSVAAAIGHASDETAARAFHRGINAVFPRSAVRYLLRADWHEHLDHALARLDQLNPPAKELLLQGLVATLMHDGRITVDEYELLRAVCATLHCPLPPLAAHQAGSDSHETAAR